MYQSTYVHYFLRPFFNTKQEQYIKWVISRSFATRQVVVVTQFRGARKSYSAQRLYLRRVFALGLRGLFWKVRYIETLDKLISAGIIPSKNSTAPSHILSHVNTFVTSFIALVCARLVSALWRGDWRRDAPSSWWDSISFVFEPPSKEDVFVVLLVCAISYRRRNVFIVDGICKMAFKSDKYLTKCDKITDVMGTLKSFAGDGVGVVILSSNEGIDRFFSDRNSTTYLKDELPRATAEELHFALNDMRLEVSIEKMQEVQQYIGMEHHVYSARWWRLVHNEFTSEYKLPRSTLHKVALDLDLEAQRVGFWFALAYSPVVDVAQSLAGYLSTAEIEAVVVELGATAPRRVVLTAALLITGRAEATTAELAKVEGRMDDIRQDLLGLEKRKLIHIMEKALSVAPVTTPNNTSMLEQEFYSLALMKQKLQVSLDRVPHIDNVGADPTAELAFYTAVSKMLGTPDDHFALDVICLRVQPLMKKLVQSVLHEAVPPHR